jgi:hypothetical protein
LAPDDITHYVCCPFLWGICALAAGSYISGDVEDRILLSAPSAAKLACLVTAFTVYHTVKLGHAAVVAEAMQSGDFDAVLALARSVADAQWNKMGAKAVDASSDVRCSKSAAVLPRDAVAIVHGRPRHASTKSSLESPFCEPECSEYPPGTLDVLRHYSKTKL